jgi:hypothetical protein
MGQFPSHERLELTWTCRKGGYEHSVYLTHNYYLLIIRF